MLLSPFLKTSKGHTSLASMIERTIDEVGMNEWARITQSLMRQPFSDPNLIPSQEEFLSRALSDWNTLIHSLKAFLKKPYLMDIASLIPQGLGLSCSFFLPHFDLILSPKQDKSRELFFHRPILVYFQIILQWWQSILAKVIEYPEISKEDRDRIARVLKSFQDFEKGLSAGTYRKDLVIKALQSFSILKKRGSLRLKVDSSFFCWLEENLLRV